MNMLQRALIEKAGHDNGFEHVLASPEAGSSSCVADGGAAAATGLGLTQPVMPLTGSKLRRCTSHGPCARMACMCAGTP